MRLFLSLAGICFATTALLAQPEPLIEPELSPKEKALEELFAENESKDAFDKRLNTAREQGASEQSLLEARFLFHVDRAEDSEIAALLPAILESKKTFALSDSAIFASLDDWLAVTEYVQALAALERGEKEKFKHHITEAFWLSPKQGAAFAPHIDRIRLIEAMKETRIDFSRSFVDIRNKQAHKLSEMLGQNKGLILHFWSPWSDECKATMADLLTTATYLTGQNFSHIAVLPETSNKVIKDANAMIADSNRKISGAWIVDSQENSLSEMLKVQTVPTVILISNDGKILFNGHPSNEEFWSSLRRINQEIRRPKEEND
jgi:hypothetical protein